jgi:2,3-bisphosphoglycerate-independent phosphoglycerate mutase
MNRALMLIGDGMADRPCPELNGRTPLQAANVPNMDRLAREGVSGACDIIAPGVRNGSDTGHLALLGYDAYAVYTGRGPFEALGIGMEVRAGDVAFRGNFATVDEKGIVTDRRAGRIKERTAELAEAMNGKVIDGVTCFVKESVEHRCALVLRGDGLSPRVSDSDPHHDKKPLLRSKPENGSPEAVRTAEVVNRFVEMSLDVLGKHPVNEARRSAGEPLANCILPRGAGMAPHLTPFNKLHNVDSACVVETGLVRGIARFVEMKPYDAPGATGGRDSDLVSMGETVLETLEKHNFVLCNVKGPDLCGHDNEPLEKVNQIEKIDKMLGMILERSKPGLWIALLADHSTPCPVGDHSGDWVALTIWGEGVRCDGVTRHDELSCVAGGLQRLRGRDVVPILTQFIGAQEKIGA